MNETGSNDQALSAEAQTVLDPSPSAKLWPPQIPDHDLIQRIGGGSYGEVWLAKNVIGTYRAVKFVSRKNFSDSRPFDREFEGMKKFEPISRSHPGFVAILHIGRDESAGYFYYIMEVADDVVSGQAIRPEAYSARTLSGDLSRRGLLPLAECLELGLSLTTALQHLHEHGLVHRDIKPANIIFLNGVPKLADIGLVTDITLSATFLGTLGYVPPQGPGSPSADLYSLGKALYELCSGKDRQQFPEFPPELEGSGATPQFRAFNEILLKACENNPDNRYQSARELHADLWKCAHGTKAGAPRTAGSSPSEDAPRPAERERKFLTVVFVNVVTTESADPEQAQLFTEKCIEVLRPAIERYEGTIIQTLSDGVLAMFGAPIASEDHAQRAVHAALAVKRALENTGIALGASTGSGFELRISINSGLVIVGSTNTDQQYSATGDAVNLASRMLGLIAPGQILITDETFKAVKDYFFTRPIGEHAMQGRAKPLGLYEVTGARARQNRLEASAVTGLTPFVGRERELALLHDRLAETRSGRGQVVLLAGEPGVGKSRLMLEFRQSSSAKETTWLSGRSLSFGHQIAYLPIIDLLRNLFEIGEADNEATVARSLERGLLEIDEKLRPGLPLLKYLFSIGSKEEAVVELEAQQRRLMIFELLRNLILKRAQRAPLVLVIEDLHWVDKTSEDFLVSLAESLTMAPVLLLASYRSTYRNPFPELSFITRLALNQLSSRESAELTSKILDGAEPPPELQRLVTAKAEGNPFFVEEMVKSLLETGALQRHNGRYEAAKAFPDIRVPETIQDIIRSRIDHLDAPAKRALQLASVIGREFAVRLLETIVGLDEPLMESLKKLKRLELIYERSLFPEHTCIFKHALTQEVAYNSLLMQRRKELHCLVAAAIEELYAPHLPDFYGLLAYHYEKGEEWERALEYLLREAETSHRVGAYREEAPLLTKAMSIAQRLGKHDLFTDLRGRRGAAWVKAGMWVEAKPDLEAALAALPPAQTVRRAELLLDLTGAYFWKLQIPEMCRCSAEGYDAAQKTDREDLKAAFEAWQGAAETSDGNLISARRFFDRALARGVGYCSASLALYPPSLYLRGRIAQSLRCARESVETYHKMGDSFAATFGHPHLGLALAAQGRYAEAIRAFDEARQLGLKYGVWTFHARGIAMSAGLHLDIFDFEGNERLALEAQEQGRSADFGPSVVSAGVDLVRNFIYRGQIDRAEQLLTETAADAIRVGGWHAWLWDLRLTQAKAELALARQQWNDALKWAQESLAKSRRFKRVKYRVAALISRAKALAELARKREAIADLKSAIRLSRPFGDPAMLLRACIAMLKIEGDESLLAEARQTATRIYRELPPGDLRVRFLAGEPLRHLGNFSPDSAQ
jgi:class 3 adenylate cyclase/tetratricopeptide (TPR) repeat protein